MKFQDLLNEKSGFDYDVYKMTSDGQFEVGSHTQKLTGSGAKVKKGDLIVFEGKANDGTDWWIYNFERGKYLQGKKSKVGTVDYISDAGKRLLNSVGMLRFMKKLNWQKELKKIVEK